MMDIQKIQVKRPMVSWFEDARLRATTDLMAKIRFDGRMFRRSLLIVESCARAS